MSGRSLRELVTSLPVTPESATDERAKRLIVRVEAEVRVEQLVDLPAYFQDLSEGERKSYRLFAQQNDEGYAEWELPVAYLTQGFYETLEVNLPFLSSDVADFEHVDIDNVETYTAARKGSFVSSRFTPEDFDLLRAQVHWLDTVHRVLNDEDEASEEDLARIPGPNDIPLFKENS